MSYQSIDKLQLTLAKKVFYGRKDPKKAAGRALGTLVEIITFYTLKDWEFEGQIRIEKGLGEYKNSVISHNVEYTLHPIMRQSNLTLPSRAPLTSTKILAALKAKKIIKLDNFKQSNSVIFTKSDTIKNACVIARGQYSSLVAIIKNIDDEKVEVQVTEQLEKPFAMFECKRVGIEEGNKKGPQTIEKAKQGAYVARAVSALQKVRNSDGKVYGVLPLGENGFRFEAYDKLLNEIVHTKDKSIYEDFILTVGVVSNHGNWFTSNNMNKELLVLSGSYDWLLFLTDNGIGTFIDELLLNPAGEYYKVQQAFLASYMDQGQSIRKSGKNQFTKTQINRKADFLLQQYFRQNREKIVQWMNIIIPSNSSMEGLKNQLKQLASKEW